MLKAFATVPHCPSCPCQAMIACEFGRLTNHSDEYVGVLTGFCGHFHMLIVVSILYIHPGVYTVTVCLWQSYTVMVAAAFKVGTASLGSVENGGIVVPISADLVVTHQPVTHFPSRNRGSSLIVPACHAALAQAHCHQHLSHWCTDSDATPWGLVWANL